MYKHNDESINCYFDMFHRHPLYLVKLVIYFKKEQYCYIAQSVIGSVLSSDGIDHISQWDKSCSVLLTTFFKNVPQ